MKDPTGRPGSKRRFPDNSGAPLPPAREVERLHGPSIARGPRVPCMPVTSVDTWSSKLTTYFGVIWYLVLGGLRTGGRLKAGGTHQLPPASHFFASGERNFSNSASCFLALAASRPPGEY